MVKYRLRTGSGWRMGDTITWNENMADLFDTEREAWAARNNMHESTGVEGFYNVQAVAVEEEDLTVEQLKVENRRLSMKVDSLERVRSDLECRLESSRRISASNRRRLRKIRSKAGYALSLDELAHKHRVGSYTRAMRLAKALSEIEAM